MTKTDQKYYQAVIDRGFEVEFQTGYKDEPWSKAKLLKMKIEESKRGYRLFVLEGWKKYSRQHVYFQRFVYLAGVECGQYWAIRCPATVTTIKEAIDYTTPAVVHKARKVGRKVIRQGDVFIIEQSRDGNHSNLPENHSFNPETRTLKHPEHKNIHIPFPCKFVQGKSVNSRAD
ncbi:MAG: hypothetical protein PVG39_00900 [Desulfobacteraceae bacterium]|jgi:hypothetical protein